jgi:ElaB/YqjD/DUF883 family membrane-anchored ribosome-binding protein
MPTTARKRAEFESDLQQQIAELRDELGSIASRLSKRGAATYDDTRDVANDVYDELSKRFSDAVPVIRRKARHVERAARDNPAMTVAVGLAVIGLAVSLFASRR